MSGTVQNIPHVELVHDRLATDDEIRQLVGDDAPRVFAIVDRCGDHRVAAWGLAMRDGVEVVSGGGLRLSTTTPDHALLLMLMTSSLGHAGLVWFDDRAA